MGDDHFLRPDNDPAPYPLDTPGAEPKDWRDLREQNRQLRIDLEAMTLERNQARLTLSRVRAYIKDCEHAPAIDEIDAVLGE